MKIEILGTGCMWTKYNSASYLIDESIMVDFPNGTCKYLYRKDIEPYKVNHILITHFHGDHYFDIPFYILNKSKKDKKESFIYCSEEGIEKINLLGNLAFPNSFNEAFSSIPVTYNTNNSFNINDYYIERILVDHGRMKPAYGYIFKKDNIYVGFTGDSKLCDNIYLMASKCNYLFIDCMFLEGNDKHMGIDNLIDLIKLYPSCKYIVTHLEDETRNKLQELNLKNVIVPTDYQTILI